MTAEYGSWNTVQMLNIAVGWARLTRAVALVIEIGPYYAQMSFSGFLVYDEVIGNTPSRPDLLSVSQSGDSSDEPGLADSELPCHPACPRRHPNFHRHWTWDVSSVDIVRDVLLTLLKVQFRSDEDPDTPVPAQLVTAIWMNETISH